MKTLLILTDFCLASQNAANYALSMLKDTTADYKILLLNTYQVPAAAADELISIHDDLRNKSKQGLDQECQRLSGQVKNAHICFEALSHMGTPEHVVPHVARERQVDCIVVGIKKSALNPGMRQLSHGRILDQINCPFLVVPLMQNPPAP